MEADFGGNVVHFGGRDLFEGFAFAGEFFVNLDDFFGHVFVGLFGAAYEGKVGSGGEAFVAVGIEADAKENCFSFVFCGRFPHGRKVRGGP